MNLSNNLTDYFMKFSSDEIIDIIQKGTGAEVDFLSPRPTTNPKLAETVSAFANTNGGHIIVGASDDGRILGISEERIKDILESIKMLCISMSVEFEIFTTDINSQVVIVLHIFKKKSEYNVVTPEGKTYYRTDNENVLSPLKKTPSVASNNKTELKCFVAKSFHEDNYPYLVDYYDAILRAANRCTTKINVKTIREIPYTGDSMKMMHDEIKKCHLMIADFTLNSPNVYYEVGFAIANKKKVIQIAEAGTELKFDLNHNNTLFFPNAHALEEQLYSVLNELCNKIVMEKENVSAKEHKGRAKG